MNSKQILDVHQMRHLQELGMKMDYDTLYRYVKFEDTDWLLKPFSDLNIIGISCKYIPAYTLQDVLDALPESILKNDIQYWLSICRVTISIWMISYSDDVDLTTNLHHEIYKSLIDAAYSMLCWAIDNKFVETNKNE